METTLSHKDAALLSQTSKATRYRLLDGFRRALEDPFMAEADRSRVCFLAVQIHASLGQPSDPPGPSWALEVKASQTTA